ncbi:MAG TPA: iron ABC transporter permease [Candidatus Brocadiia bacterium]|nr:iron ABC transporter permease [Candidatus Brocadiia bacterium]
MTGQQNKHWRLIYAGLFAALGVSCLFSLFAGAVPVSFAEVRIAVARMLGLTREIGDPIASAIVEMRLARIMLGVAAGAGLSAAGVAFQGILRNPLAEPYVLGVSSGAGLGAACAIMTGAAALGAWTLPAMAFAGALGTIALVYAVARAGRLIPIQTLLLSGVIVGTVLSSILMFLVSISSARELHDVVWWMLGKLQISDWALLWWCSAVIAGGIAVCMVFARDLNVIALGEEPAAHLGLNVERAKVLFFVVASLVTGAVVASCGLIGFVGLIVPHSARLAIGPDHRRLLPVSALAGACFLVLADAFARTLAAPNEIPIGVVTAFLGGPFFIFLLRSRKRMF